MAKRTKKLHEIEILRAFAIILIVIFHSIMYLQIPYKNLIPWDFVAQLGLSLFFFISGFVLYYNYNDINLKNDLKSFYYKRLVRIYPLYWFALIVTFSWMIYSFKFISFPPNQYDSILNLTTLLVGFLGLQGLADGNSGFNQSLFWFIGVILIYYILYPFIIRPKNLINMFSVSLIFILLLYYLNIQLSFIPGLFIFFWLFFAGIAICWLNNNYTNFSNIKLNLKNINLVLFLKYIFPLLLLFLLIQTQFQNYYLIILKFSLSTLIVYAITKLTLNYLTKKNNKFFNSLFYNLILKISYGSYATYLIHVTIFLIIIDILAKLHLSEYQTIIIAMGIPISFLIGYYLQVEESKIRKYLGNIKTFKKEIELVKSTK